MAKSSSNGARLAQVLRFVFYSDNPIKHTVWIAYLVKRLLNVRYINETVPLYEVKIRCTVYFCSLKS